MEPSSMVSVLRNVSREKRERERQEYKELSQVVPLHTTVHHMGIACVRLDWPKYQEEGRE